MRDPRREQRLAAIAADTRRDHADFLNTDEGQRVSQFLAFLDGSRTPPPVEAGRKIHQRMHVPGLTARAYWPADTFPLHKLLQDRFPLIQEEAHRLLRDARAFERLPGESHVGNDAIDGGRLNGIWKAYYLQRYFERDNRTAEFAPVALRTLDGHRVSREALFSVVGPFTHIRMHSDELNFVTTLYLPLVSDDGAWIEFAGEKRGWTPGRCFAADSTFLHQSFNGTEAYRVILIVDLWHPELTAREIDLLEAMMPPIDAVMRGRRNALR